MILQIFSRIFLLIAVLIISLLTSDLAHQLNQEIFGYQKPPGFFGFTLADWEIAWVVTSVFWGGVIFGIFGKKIDYIFFIFLFLFALWDYVYPPSVPAQMYLGLIGATVVGNLIGFGLKLLRLKYWPRP